MRFEVSRCDGRGDPSGEIDCWQMTARAAEARLAPLSQAHHREISAGFQTNLLTPQARRA